MKKLSLLILSILIVEGAMAQLTRAQLNKILNSTAYPYKRASQINLSFHNILDDGTALIRGTNTYTANTIINATGTFSWTTSGLFTLAPDSVSLTGTKIRFINGAGVNKLLTSDANGYATWQTNIIAPLITGGTGTTSTLKLKSTSGVGTTGADIIFQIGNNGGTEAMRILNSGFVGIGTNNPVAVLDVIANSIGGGINITGTGVNSPALKLFNGTTQIMNFLAANSANDGLTGSAINDGILKVAQNKALLFGTNNLERMRIDAGGNIGIGVAAPTATLHLKAGTATASTAPFKYTSGTLLTTAEAGAKEFLTDKEYLTITTGAARKEITLNDIALTSGRVPYLTTEGRLTDASTMTFNGTTLTAAGFTTGGTLTLNDGANVATGTTTGTKIGTGTTQKIGFWNATPVVQPAANANTTGAILSDLEIEVNQLKQLLRDIGVMAP